VNGVVVAGDATGSIGDEGSIDGAVGDWTGVHTACRFRISKGSSGQSAGIGNFKSLI